MAKDSSIEFTQSLFDNGEFYKVLRTKMGENIWCMMRSDIQSVTALPYITLVNPVLVSQIKEMRQQNDPNVLSETWAIRPWMGMSDSQEFVIGTEILMTIGNLKEKAREQYQDYLIKVQILEEAQKLAEMQQGQEAAINALLLSISSSGEVRFITDGEQ